MLLTLLVALFTTPSASATANNSELQGRLENLATELEKQRVAFHIPGMAIAVVRDDQIVFARGFGVADIDKKTPVTPHTLFAIGSSTKAFTATLIGLMVDDGRMQWDDRYTLNSGRSPDMMPRRR